MKYATEPKSLIISKGKRTRKSGDMSPEEEAEVKQLFGSLAVSKVDENTLSGYYT